jgi:hypothetical protein
LAVAEKPVLEVITAPVGPPSFAADRLMLHVPPHEEDGTFFHGRLLHDTSTEVI